MAPTKVLIFVAIGDNCEAKSWLENFPDKPDYETKIILVYYGKNRLFKNTFTDTRINIIEDASPSKFEKFLKYVEKGVIEISDFDLIWIVDDDIRISNKNILNFFNSFLKYDLEIAQPGCLGFAMGKQIVRRDSRFILRYSNYVDGIAPIFSRSALLKCIQTFRDCKSGRGIDHVWAALLGNPKNKIAIIDSSVMYHMKPSGMDYSRFDNSISEQYNNVKNRYITILEPHYSWGEKIIHDSIAILTWKQKFRYFNKIVDKFLEVYQVGLRKLIPYFLTRLRLQLRDQNK